MRAVAARLLIMEKPSAILTKATEHMGISSLTGKYLKNIKQFATVIWLSIKRYSVKL